MWQLHFVNFFKLYQGSPFIFIRTYFLIFSTVVEQKHYNWKAFITQTCICYESLTVLVLLHLLHLNNEFLDSVHQIKHKRFKMGKMIFHTTAVLVMKFLEDNDRNSTTENFILFVLWKIKSAFSLCWNSFHRAKKMEVFIQKNYIPMPSAGLASC